MSVKQRTRAESPDRGDSGQRGVMRERHAQTRSAIAQLGDKYWICVARDSAEDATQSIRSRSLAR